jgi:hypothetical protein
MSGASSANLMIRLTNDAPIFSAFAITVLLGQHLALGAVVGIVTVTGKVKAKPSTRRPMMVFMKAAQLGATEMGSNWIGYVIHHAPGPMMRFENLRWEKGQPETAAYVCQDFNTPIAERYKSSMLENGEWRPTAEGNGRTVGFHLSSLYSPIGWRSWAHIARAWETAVSKESGSASAIKTFRNTELGETWIEEGEAPDWQRLLERREHYPIGSVPAGGLLLVGGADVQKDRIEVSIWAFGRGKECWLIEHRVLMGDTARESVWKRLAELVAETWRHDSGARLSLARFALDTGFATQETYSFIRNLRDSRVMAVKGVARGAALIGVPTAVDVTSNGKRLRRGIKVFTVTTGIAKMEFYNHLRKAADVAEDGITSVYPAGFVHLPQVDGEFLQQLCAEQLVTRRNRNGFAIREWQKLRERNEALDCYVYARAAAAAAGLGRFDETHWREMERQLRSTPELKPNTQERTENLMTTEATLQILEPGEDVRFSDPADVGGAYSEFLRNQFRAVPHVLHSVWPRPRRDPRAGAGASSALFSRWINPSRQDGPAAYGNHRSPRGLLPDQAVVPGVFFCRRLLRGQVIGAIRWPTDGLADQRPSAHEFPGLIPPAGQRGVGTLPDTTAAGPTTAGHTRGRRARDSARRCCEQGFWYSGRGQLRLSTASRTEVAQSMRSSTTRSL